MKAFFLAAVLLSCSPSALQVQAHIANGVAIAANDALTPIVTAYRLEGDSAIASAQTRDAAETALAAVRTRWQPVWGSETDGTPCRGAGDAFGSPCRNGAWQALMASEDAWGVALEHQIAGAPLDLITVLRLAQDMRTNYCTLRRVIPNASVHLADLPATLACDPSGTP